MANGIQDTEETTGNAIVREVPISNSKMIKEFVVLERKLIGANPLFVSEIDSDNYKRLKGQSAFFSDMEHALFVSSDGTQDKSRCAAFINHRYQQAKEEAVGFIGYFAAADNANSEVRAMLDKAETWLRERSVSRVITPFNFSFLIGFGLLTTAFEEEPMFPLLWHPPHYKDYFQNAGYQPTYPFWCYAVNFSSEKYRLVAQNALKNNAIKILPFNKKNWNTDLDEFRKLINETFKEEWESHPHTSEEFHEFCDPFKPVFDPRLWLMAEVEGRLAGFCWGAPDWSPMFRSFKGKMGPIQIIKFMLKAKKYNRAGLIAIGVLPEYRGSGVAQALAITLYKRFEEQGLKQAFYYPVNESNTRSRRFAESMGGTGRVMYHCYDKHLL
jgi:GNAT superfamily N-acetyltransferase